jgi:hypothetical protein
MAVRATPSFLQAGSHPAEETRLMVNALAGGGTGSFTQPLSGGSITGRDSAHGIINDSDLAVTQNGTPNMSVNVAAGSCLIRGMSSAVQGAYHLVNDGTLNVAISAADATNPRRDLIIAVVRDAAYSGASNDARIIVVTGTPAASPSDPSLTSNPNALVLARVAVAAGATSITNANITDLRQFALTAGEIPVTTTTAARDIRLASPTDGQAHYLNSNTTTEGLWFYNGTSWRLPWNMPWGTVGYDTDTTTGSASTGSYVDTGLTVTTSTLPANRLIQWTFSLGFYSSVANDRARIAIRSGSNVVQTAFVTTLSPTGAGVVNTFTGTWYEVSTAAALTRKISYLRESGTGNVQSYGDSTFVGALVGVDLGPTGAPS